MPIHVDLGEVHKKLVARTSYFDPTFIVQLSSFLLLDAAVSVIPITFPQEGQRPY